LRKIKTWRRRRGEGRGCAFPCAASGCVDLDPLSPRSLDNDLYARTVIGRELFMPAVGVAVHRLRRIKSPSPAMATLGPCDMLPAGSV
jgi:hypothetical protein